MDSGAWRATVHRVTRVRQNLVTKTPLPSLLPRQTSHRFSLDLGQSLDTALQGSTEVVLPPSSLLPLGRHTSGQIHVYISAGDWV